MRTGICLVKRMLIMALWPKTACLRWLPIMCTVSTSPYGARIALSSSLWRPVVPETKREAGGPEARRMMEVMRGSKARAASTVVVITWSVVPSPMESHARKSAYWPSALITIVFTTPAGRLTVVGSQLRIVKKDVWKLRLAEKGSVIVT